MKWSLQQLFKYNKKEFSFSTTYDFKEYIKDIDDILDIKEVYVDGIGQNIVDDRYRFDLKIRTVLVLEDSRTLDPVHFPIDINVTEYYDVIESNDDEDVRVIEKNTIDLEDAVWENILLSKPIRVVKDELPE